MTITVVAEQLRRPVPGGIGTYVRGLFQGLAAMPDAPPVTRWTSRLAPQVRSRLWDRGIGRVPGDVVHAPSLAIPRVDGRLVVVVHDLAWRDAPETFPTRGREWHERAFGRAVRRADRFVVPSTDTADRVVQAGVSRERVTVIPEGADHLPPPDDAGAAEVVKGEFVLTVATLEPRKNLARLVEAYQRARPQFGADLPLVAVGPRGWGSVAVPNGVVAAGAVSDAVLAALYGRARVVAYVPLVEGFGLPPVEAMRAGAPVVASTAVPSSRGAALDVDATDVDAIADALVRAVTDDALRAELVDRGTTRARSLTWAAAAEAHVDLWREVAG